MYTKESSYVVYGAIALGQKQTFKRLDNVQEMARFCHIVPLRYDNITS